MKNKASWFIVFSIFLLVGWGCKDKNMQSKQTPSPTSSNNTQSEKVETKNIIVDIPNLANKSPQEFEKTLGKATEITKITKTPEEMPGEFRHYKLPDLPDTLQVRFYKDKAVAFVMTLPKEKQTKKPEELAALAGFDVKSPSDSSTYYTNWQGNFNGVNFKEIKAMKTNVDDYNNLVVKVQ